MNKSFTGPRPDVDQRFQLERTPALRFVAYIFHALGRSGPELLVVALLTGAILATAINFLQYLLPIAAVFLTLSARSCLPGYRNLRRRGVAAW